MDAMPARFTSRTLSFALLAALLLAVAILSGCGKKGPVRPRLTALPAAPPEARIDQRGDDFLISWRIPEVNQDATPAEDLRGFNIYRLIYLATEGCPTCRDPEELIAAVDLLRPEPAMRLGKRIYWRDAAVAPGTGHAYLIVPVTLGDQEGTGIGVYRTWELPPPPPLELRAEVDTGPLRLSWSPPPALPDGQELLGYNLYRRSSGEPFAPVALNAEPLAETQLSDFAVAAGREAVYRLTTVVRSGGQVLESAPSEEVSATPPLTR
jgi:predicted small lipoprotein YifL